MSATLNINQDVEDTFYRYKMPKPQFKIEGRGNGIKTVIINIIEISKALSRPPAYITKFIGSELGAQTITNAEEGKYLLKGNHSYDKMVEKLYAFILKFVLCPECDNPETRLQVVNESVFRLCAACGKKTEIKSAEKLCSYILKNPPKDTVLERGHEAPVGSQIGSSGIGDGLYSDDTARAKRQFTKTELESFEALGDFVNTLNPDDTAILSYVKEHNIPYDDATVILAQILLKEKIDNRPALFRSLTADNKKAQLALLGAFERIVSEINARDTEFKKIVNKKLSELYQAEMVDEDTFYEWHALPDSGMYVRRKMFKKIRDASLEFVEWLRNAEEESD